MSQKDTEYALNGTFDFILNMLKSNPKEKVKLGAFTFETKEVKAKTMPAKKVVLREVPMDIPETFVPAHTKIVVKVSKKYKKV